MSQADDFARKVLGAKENLGFEASLAWLRQAGGSGRGAARLAGVDESTLRKWATGKRKPSTGAKERIIAAVREQRTPKPTPDSAVGFKVQSHERRHGRPRERTIKAGALKLAPGTMAKARNDYITGGSTAALKTFLNGIGEPFYKAALTPAEWNDDDVSSDYGMSF